MKLTPTFSTLATLTVALAGCGAEMPHQATSTAITAAAPAAPSALQAVADSLNHLFTRVAADGTKSQVTVGPADGSIKLTVGEVAPAADGTVAAHVQRHDRDGAVHDYAFDLVFAEDAANQVSMSVRYPDGRASASYLVRRTGDAAVSWVTGKSTPWNHAATGGSWVVEFDSTDVHLDAAGKVLYTIQATEYPLQADYIAAHYQEKMDAQGHRFLVDAMTGQEVTFTADQGAGLVQSGAFGEPTVKTLPWVQL